MLTTGESAILGEIEPEALYRLTTDLVRKPSVSGEERGIA